MDNIEFDRRVGVIEDALYELKESGYADVTDVRAIDDMLAIKAELKVELYGMLIGWQRPSIVATHLGSPLPLTWRRRLLLWIDELNDRLAMAKPPAFGWVYQWTFVFAALYAAFVLNDRASTATFLVGWAVIHVIRKGKQ